MLRRPDLATRLWAGSKKRPPWVAGAISWISSLLRTHPCLAKPASRRRSIDVKDETGMAPGLTVPQMISISAHQSARSAAMVPARGRRPSRTRASHVWDTPVPLG